MDRETWQATVHAGLKESNTADRACIVAAVLNKPGRKLWSLLPEVLFKIKIIKLLKTFLGFRLFPRCPLLGKGSLTQQPFLLVTIK